MSTGKNRTGRANEYELAAASFQEEVDSNEQRQGWRDTARHARGRCAARGRAPLCGAISDQHNGLSKLTTTGLSSPVLSRPLPFDKPLPRRLHTALAQRCGPCGKLARSSANESTN
eukprot:1146095-Pleurochrysis_carterae.AAC.1